MALATIAASELAPTRRQAEKLDKARDEHVLIHDGKRVVVMHGPESCTACGDPSLTMVIGSRQEIEAEIKRLKLAAQGELAESDAKAADLDR